MKISTAGCIACVALLAACEHPGTPAPRLAPSPAANVAAASAAIGAPAAEVRRAEAALASRVDGWALPQLAGAAPGGPATDAAMRVANSSAENVAAATAALNAFVQASAAPAPKTPPE